ncbi:MAG TPA: hypothetical protein VNT00_08580 [Eoetvoesiella sp.]|jgi:hypothetical protein|uniref:hypothetical protein n=1 Tax=Eoetvoesiella sp. TaxID=1966355 RepID=UPI002BF06D18|nr:hypothetical protein [Eoetvoesiella sp.]HWK61461.1 hypothetical protein [Eoetvoesiella sp.]
MKFLFILVVIANLAVFGLGMGFFGKAPYSQGLQPNPPQEINPQAIRLGAPGSATQPG